MSARPCGCDEEARHTCDECRKQQILAQRPTFEIKDSGKRQEFGSGMQRDTEEGKLDYTLLRDGPMFKRWAIHLTNGAKKYDRRNWMKGNSQAELDRAYRSVHRHFEQWLAGEVDEDHAAAIFFNINQCEFLKNRLDKKV